MITKLNNGGRHNQLEIKVKYELGGTNYFSGGYSVRGYYIYFSPFSGGSNGFRESTLLGDKKESGFKINLEQTARKSVKRISELSQKVDAIGITLSDLFNQGKYNDIFSLVKAGF